MNDKIPLSVLMENARGKLTQAFNQIINESGLPAYLIEGILLELLSETRNRKNLELVSDINTFQSQKNIEKEV